MSRLPSRLVVHAFSWLDVRSLTGAIVSSRNFGELALDPLWQAHYLRTFEEASSSDPTIAPNGAETSWRQRYLNRQRIQRNRLALRCAKIRLTLPTSREREGVVGVTSSFIVSCQLQEHQSGRMSIIMRVRSLPNFSEAYRLETPYCFPEIADGREPKLLLTIPEFKVVQLYDLHSGALIRSWPFDIGEARAIYREIAMAAGGRLFAVHTSQPDSNGRPRWSIPTLPGPLVTTRLRVINLESDAAPVDEVSNIDFPVCRVTQDNSSVLVIGVVTAEVWSVEIRADGEPRLQLNRRFDVGVGFASELLAPKQPAGDVLLQFRTRGLDTSRSPSLHALSRNGLVDLDYGAGVYTDAVPLQHDHIALYHRFPQGELEVLRLDNANSARKAKMTFFEDRYGLAAVNWRYMVFNASDPAHLLLLDFASPPPTLGERVAKFGRSALAVLARLVK